MGDVASDLANSFMPLLVPAGTYVQTNSDGTTTIYKQPSGNQANVFSSTGVAGPGAVNTSSMLPILLLVGGAVLLMSGRKH